MTSQEIAQGVSNSRAPSTLWELRDTDRLGLALSGGGFRASLFHIGVLARLAELDFLRHVTVLSTVSGGSIIGAYYYLKIKELLEGRGHKDDRKAKPSKDAYIAIVKEIERDFLREVQKNIRMRALLDPLSNAKMILSDDYSDSDRMAELYDKHFYMEFAERLGLKKFKLTDLKIYPDPAAVGIAVNKEHFNVDEYNNDPKAAYKIPILNINATSINSGHRWCFTGAWVGESLPLDPSNGAHPLCAAIDTNVRLRRLQLDGAYSSYLADPDTDARKSKWEPPLSDPDPAKQEKLDAFTALRKAKLGDLTLADAVAASAGVPGIFTPLSIHDLYWNSRQEEIVVELVDGGVYDNQGLDALRSSDPACNYIVCSDASGQLEDDRAPSSAIFSVVSRTNDILMTRVRAECYNRLCVEFPDRAKFFHLRDEFQGNDNYPAIPGPVDRSNNKNNGLVYRLSNLRTDLDTFTDIEAYSLMYDGYCLCDSRVVASSETLNVGSGAPNEIPGAANWEFLEIKRMLNKNSNEEEELLAQLYVGSNLSFKVFRLFSLKPFRLYPLLSWIFVAVLAAPIVSLCLIYSHTVWATYAYITENIGLLVPIIALFLALKKSFETSPIVRNVLDRLRPLRRGSVMGLIYPFAVVGAIGTVAAAVHLLSFDPMFKKAGRLPPK